MVLSAKEIGRVNLESLARFVAHSIISNSRNLGQNDSGRKHFAMPNSESLMPDSRELESKSALDKPEFTFLNIEPEPDKGQVGTAGFDLRVGRLIAWSDYLTERVSKQELISMKHRVLEPGENFVLDYDKHGGKIYYATSFEQVHFSPNLEILVDSKSTTGRVGCMSHHAGTTKEGELITIIQPYAFPIKVTCGKTRLSQVAVRYKDTEYMANDEILKSEEVKFECDGVSKDKNLTSKGLLMQFDTKRAYRAKKCEKPIDMDARGLLWQDYFELIDGNSEIVLDSNTLHLLGSLGVIQLGGVCGLLSREQDVLTGTGTWGHFAGIFQPFFSGGITMEVYSFAKRKIRKGNNAGVVIFDKVDGVIDRPENYGGAYQGQIPPLLPKMFASSNV